MHHYSSFAVTDKFFLNNTSEEKKINRIQISKAFDIDKFH